MEILLTGATGFVGTAVLARLRTMPDVTRVRVLSRGPDRAPRGVDVVRGDLAETRTIVGAAEGADVVIHAAGYVGNDPRMATSVNDAGTRALAGECTRSGARLIAVSTTAVYGPGPHRLAREGEVAMHPVSAASVSRSAGEAHVLSAGGTVVRAALTYGGGDRWFIPTALAGVRALGGWWAVGTRASRPSMSARWRRRSSSWPLTPGSFLTRFSMPQTPNPRRSGRCSRAWRVGLGSTSPR
ncbi:MULTISPECIES: NAD-dependent epimerase/dehydratase family protein [unclassified Pseudoclavibacter]|uniref:NAD-dependent epimerase/dehydratase family protein n=1 Tax=unclassified Pseudoclavibacter TaxID=2615177 RepID=UPI001BA73BD7|nr:NAD(P)-dependent oxidoreductase [Pseudoclavibacter sp. Marseille-Q4354]MBS3178168.1 NAD(P)-dependent oxidoreductase [Pseudoclavibacter sp. Marseille-Q4354]